MINKIKIHISESLNAYENLAMEKCLLDSVDDTTAILYLWQNANTVVIGRNQNPLTECNCALMKEENVALARRLSGGGAVYHDTGNLNFTFISSTENHSVEKNLQIIKKACLMAGIMAEVSGRNDILVNGKKFSGNAFYSAGNKTYHHGTLMVVSDKEKMGRYLTPSKAKLTAKGIKSVKSRVVNLSELVPSLDIIKMKEYMILAFTQEYGLNSEPVDFSDNEKLIGLQSEYSSWEYLYAASFPFTFSFRERFSWGEADIGIEVKKGIISNVGLYTDSMDWTIPGILKNSLIGIKFNLADINAALSGQLPHSVSSDILSIFQTLLGR